TLIGTLAGIARYPIKSLHPQPLDRAQVVRDGIEGDRTEAFFVRAGAQRLGKTYRGKENDHLHLISDAHEARADAARRGVEVELRNGERFFDDAPISIVLDRWLEALSQHVGYAVEWQRFRPNLFVRGAGDFDLPETALAGATLSVGRVRLVVRAPILRCVVPTYDPYSTDKDPEVLRFVANQRGNVMGIYCDVTVPGDLRLGDEVIRNA
ncbi:MAG: MOSC domain-containing protein, partial [Candidatus Eremiobacteraeota bacterium]|nr:MOSC domain-containing protein [Candidatus Eremiobacteraeota bacterium]